jgi:hypothetical protein
MAQLRALLGDLDPDCTHCLPGPLTVHGAGDFHSRDGAFCAAPPAVQETQAWQGAGIGLALTGIILLNVAPDPGGGSQELQIISSWMLYALLCLLSYGFAMITQKAATYYIIR